jgi:hypothetical protein
MFTVDTLRRWQRRATGLSQGTRLVATPDDSWALLTMHKAASSYVGDVLSKVFASQGYATVDITSEAFAAGEDEVDFLRRHQGRLSRPRTFHGPFRTDAAAVVAETPGLKVVLHIRDPRDCVVSMYYSSAFSHIEPGPGPVRDSFLAQREIFRSWSVEEFALEGLRRGYRALGLMRNIMESRTDAVLSRYENLVTDFEGWLKDLADRIALPLNRGVLNELVASAEFDVVEDPFRHKRQVTPGDFRRKLSKRVQDRLTEAFREDLEYFGYPLD